MEIHNDDDDDEVEEEDVPQSDRQSLTLVQATNMARSLRFSCHEVMCQNLS